MNMIGISKTRLALLLVALASFAFGIWTGCSVGFDTAQSGKFPCTDDSDCINGFECLSNLCQKIEGSNNTVSCNDADGDGFGVGETLEERQGCPQCENFGLCDEDCNDMDPAINPGAIEQCNNIDDNCNGEVDDPTPCMDNGDCTDLQGPPNTQPQCDMNTNTCQIFMVTQICTGGVSPCPCNNQPQMCTEGMYPTIPEPSECIQ